MRTSGTRRRAAIIATTIAGLVAVSACSPVTTDMNYAPSDGVRASVSTVTGINLLAVANDEGTRANFVGAFTNSGSESVNVTLEIPTGTIVADKTVAARGLVDYNQDTPLSLQDLSGAKPGTFLTATIKAGDQSTQVRIPVLGHREEQGVDHYNDLVPSGE
ncbi:hypothetical protein [Rarobacter incanus]|uniref:Copper(I)-binding protein n=1 Tax=Rarobacter incanus TaxID=153494 RepID=A0A542SNX6_9MICO|nr:hypothetical protein [Rarobacter incanus]TQK76341.1 hypothetical protein FB389_1010 [Rarobacter incanus]